MCGGVGASALSSMRKRRWQTGPMHEVLVSASSGTALRVNEGRYELGSPSGWTPIEKALVGLLPLLEREPHDGLRQVEELQGPPFPWGAVLATALGGASAYWQERAVDWLAALGTRPEGPVEQAARHAVELQRASQRHRQQLQRWLDGKPMRRL